jgi:HEPN domain-containing protein
MKDETAEWVEKAEGDWRTARREFAVCEGPNYDAVCFHAQQCAEKYLKARMIEGGLSIPRIHDLEALLNLLLPVEPQWSWLMQPAITLSVMAVEVRYPGMSADVEDAENGLRSAEKIRDAVRTALNLS